MEHPTNEKSSTATRCLGQFSRCGAQIVKRESEMSKQKRTGAKGISREKRSMDD